jgi:hypothetical protein
MVKNINILAIFFIFYLIYGTMNAVSGEGEYILV